MSVARFVHQQETAEQLQRFYSDHHGWLSCGFALLGIAGALCVYRDGPGFGAVLWVVLISSAALAVAFTLAWQPRLFGAAARFVRRR